MGRKHCHPQLFLFSLGGFPNPHFQKIGEMWNQLMTWVSSSVGELLKNLVRHSWTQCKTTPIWMLVTHMKTLVTPTQTKGMHIGFNLEMRERMKCFDLETHGAIEMVALISVSLGIWDPKLELAMLIFKPPMLTLRWPKK